MRYSLDIHSANDLLVVHLNKRLTNGGSFVYDGTLDGPLHFDLLIAKDLFNVEGVERVGLYGHTINIHKAQVFEWRPIIAEVIMHLWMRLSEGDRMVMKRPIRFYDEDGDLENLPSEVSLMEDEEDEGEAQSA